MTTQIGALFVLLVTCFPSSNYRHVISDVEITAIADFCDYHFVVFFAMDRLLAIKWLGLFHALTLESFTESVNDFHRKTSLLNTPNNRRFMARIKNETTTFIGLETANKIASTYPCVYIMIKMCTKCVV